MGGARVGGSFLSHCKLCPYMGMVSLAASLRKLPSTLVGRARNIHKGTIIMARPALTPDEKDKAYKDGYVAHKILRYLYPLSYPDGYMTSHQRLLYSQEIVASEDNPRKAARQRQYYPYISAGLHSFMYSLRTEIKKRRINPATSHFLDVGCGIGDKLWVAVNMLGFQRATGIEVDEYLVDIARDTLKDDPRINVIHNDAFKERYGAYDFIYMYRPISSNAWYAKLRNHIIKTVKPSVRVFEIFPLDVVVQPDYRWTEAGNTGNEVQHSDDQEDMGDTAQ